jgi:hypothetical protein
MALKFKYKSKEEIPAEHGHLYVSSPDGSGFVLDAEGAVEKSRVDEFRNNNVALKRQLDELLKKYEGLDPDEARKLLEQKQKVEEGQLLKEGDVEKIVLARVKAAIDPIEKRAQAAEQSAAKTSERLADIEINRAAIVAATKMGLRPSAIPDLTLRARTVFRMVDGKSTAFDADGKTPLYGADGLTPLTLDEWVAKLVVEAPHLFEPNAGGGATGSNPASASGAGPIKNPFKRGPEWNLTEQMKITKRDPKLAERLKAAA